MANNTGSANQTSNPAGDGISISAPRARQAYKGGRILWILLASLAAVVIAFVIAFATNPTTPVANKAGSGQVKTPAAAFHAPDPAPKEPS